MTGLSIPARRSHFPQTNDSTPATADLTVGAGTSPEPAPAAGLAARPSENALTFANEDVAPSTGHKQSMPGQSTAPSGTQLMRVAMAIAFFTGLAGDLLVQPLTKHLSDTEIPTAAGALAAAMLPIARFTGSILLAQLANPLVSLLFAVMGLIGYLVLFALPKSGVAFILAFFSIGLGEQLASVQMHVSTSGMDEQLRRNAATWLWSAYMLGCANSFGASGIIYSFIGWKGLAAFGIAVESLTVALVGVLVILVQRSGNIQRLTPRHMPEQSAQRCSRVPLTPAADRRSLSMGLVTELDGHDDAHLVTFPSKSIYTTLMVAFLSVSPDRFESSTCTLQRCLAGNQFRRDTGRSSQWFDRRWFPRSIQA